ncbi:hypothetical protein [Alteromonas macleodii]|jgi:hypothetical protein|nr:hypothetical protein [Alteromonas macleodii]MCZ4241072.1 hypothetical protein [Alteromonas macleodii]|tara:strand:- start:12846 stop:12986 length:141 start_codon:yes stop_codon:yes gene_type:complete
MANVDEKEFDILLIEIPFLFARSSFSSFECDIAAILSLEKSFNAQI